MSTENPPVNTGDPNNPNPLPKPQPQPAAVERVPVEGYAVPRGDGPEQDDL